MNYGLYQMDEETKQVRAWLKSLRLLEEVQYLDLAYEHRSPKELETFKKNICGRLNPKDSEAMFWKERIEKLKMDFKFQLSLFE